MSFLFLIFEASNYCTTRKLVLFVFYVRGPKLEFLAMFTPCYIALLLRNSAARAGSETV